MIILFKVSLKESETTSLLKKKMSSLLPPLIQVLSIKLMLRLPILNFLGKIKEVSLWKLAAFKLGSVIYKLLNLLKCGLKDTLKKPFAFLMIKLQRKFW